MARTKEFDCERALDDALRLFWEKGYEATSVQNLVDATGVNRASLYDTFGSKSELFQKVLDRFALTGNNIEHATLGVAPGLERIRAALRQAGEQCRSDVRGCLVVNAVVERATRDHAMEKIGEESRVGLEQFFMRSLEAAERRGEIGRGKDLRALARYLVNVLFGLRVTAKTRPAPGVVQDIVETTLRTIE